MVEDWVRTPVPLVHSGVHEGQFLGPGYENSDDTVMIIFPL